MDGAQQAAVVAACEFFYSGKLTNDTIVACAWLNQSIPITQQSNQRRRLRRQLQASSNSTNTTPANNTTQVTITVLDVILSVRGIVLDSLTFTDKLLRALNENPNDFLDLIKSTPGTNSPSSAQNPTYFGDTLTTVTAFDPNAGPPPMVSTSSNSTTAPAVGTAGISAPPAAGAAAPSSSPPSAAAGVDTKSPTAAPQGPVVPFSSTITSSGGGSSFLVTTIAITLLSVVWVCVGDMGH
jgi:hypothetical protein